MLKISVPVPHVNRGVHSAEAVASVISQKFPEFEINIDDDGFLNSEFNQIKEFSEVQTFKNELQKLKFLQNSYLELQNDFANLQEDQANVQQDYAILQAAKINLYNEYKQTFRQLQLSNKNYEEIINTKVWQAVNFWQKVKQEIMLGFPQKRERLTMLWNTTLSMWEAEGFTAVTDRAYRFFKGERRHSKPVPAEKNQEITSYKKWIEEKEPDQTEFDLQRRKERDFVYRPLISILTPVYNTGEIMLEEMICSVLVQTYSNWELCIVSDDAAKPQLQNILNVYLKYDKRIKVKYLDDKQSVSDISNETLKIATGEFITLLNHADELSPDALYENVLVLNKKPTADMIYSDEDKLNLQGLRYDPYFKPDWSPDFFYSSMYACRLALYRKELVDKLGGFRADFDGAQDYDLALRLIEQTNQIHHIPKILYHWRKVGVSTTDANDEAKLSQIKAVSEHLKRLKVKAEVTPGLANNLLRVKRQFSTEPKVSIIIPTRDKVEFLQQCIASIQKLSSYQNYEIIIVDNNSLESKSLKYFNKISKEPNVRVIEYQHPFNFAAINNFAASQADGELLLFLNNDTKVISAEWLESMIEHAVRPEVGAVGARLLYPNGEIQHAGVIIGIGGVAGHSHKHFHNTHPGYFSRAKAIQNLSAVTGACLMVRSEVFNLFGGFDEENLAIAYNDIDLCLKMRQKNLLIVYTPYAELYHYESISRGSDYTPKNIKRFEREGKYMSDYWKEILHSDPYYNPNLTMEKEDFSIAGSAQGVNLNT